MKNKLSVHTLGNYFTGSKKYGSRYYRFLTLEAGHCAQNLYLVTTSLNAGIVASGGFYDYDLPYILEFDKKKYLLLYELFLGNVEG